MSSFDDAVTFLQQTSANGSLATAGSGSLALIELIKLQHKTKVISL
jgi:hypothetical protein